MARVLYTVTAELDSPELEREYTAWLLEGHVQAVVRGGASSARVVRLDDPPTPIRVEAHYLFPNPEAFDEYLRVTAPALRQEGLERFPPSRGIRLSRRRGVILGEAD